VWAEDAALHDAFETEQQAKGRLWARMSLLDDPSQLSMAIAPPCSIRADYGLGLSGRLRRNHGAAVPGGGT
jgi:hypothetical protein